MITKNIYEFEVDDVECPVDGQKIRYHVVLTTSEKILVEDIFDFFETVKTHPIFQEDLTRAICRHFGCDVEITGIHSGVAIRSDYRLQEGIEI